MQFLYNVTVKTTKIMIENTTTMHSIRGELKAIITEIINPCFKVRFP